MSSHNTGDFPLIKGKIKFVKTVCVFVNFCVGKYRMWIVRGSFSMNHLRMLCKCCAPYVNIQRRNTECNRRNGPDVGRVFLRSYYTGITQNTYIQSSLVTEILAREV